LSPGGEGVDADFTPDVLLSDGDVVESDGWALTARHTPGHFGNHLSFLMGDVALTGDHLMGWATSLVSPPDGDLTDFMASCAKLSQTTMVRALPGHGAPIEDAQTRLADLIAHRKGREAGVRQHLSQVGPSTVAEISSALYTDTPTPLLPMAQRNVLAHLIDLTNRGIARPDDALSADATFRLS
ncbi:MAG: MBL fold metallo-hydrolase, partial [Pseudomonadota bacterium]